MLRRYMERITYRKGNNEEKLEGSPPEGGHDSETSGRVSGD